VRQDKQRMRVTPTEQILKHLKDRSAALGLELFPINQPPDSIDRPTLGKIIGAFKSIVTDRVILLGSKTKGGRRSIDDYGSAIITNISCEMILRYRRFSSIFSITL
jgi:hypothetical protein